MLAYMIRLNWWLPTAALVYLTIAPYLVFRRTRRWAWCILVGASGLAFFAGIFYLLISPVTIHSLGELFTSSQDRGHELQTNIWTELWNIAWWLAHAIAAVGAACVIAGFRQKPMGRACVSKPWMIGPDVSRTWRELWTRTNRLPITVCACIGVEVIVWLISDFLGFNPPLPDEMDPLVLLAILSLISAAVVVSVLMIATKAGWLWMIAAGLMVGIVYFVVSMGLGVILIILSAVAGLSTAILLIIRDRTWLALGIGGILVSLMILFPSPPRFLW